MSEQKDNPNTDHEKDTPSESGNDPFAWAIGQLEKMRNGQLDVEGIKDMVDTAKEKMSNFFNRS